MFARAITFHYQPGTLDQAVEILRATVMPELRSLSGFEGATNLIDRENNKVLGITYWKTRDDLENSGRSINHPLIQERLAKVSVYFAGPPAVINYEVSDDE